MCVQVQERTKFNWTIKISDIKLKLKIKTRIRIGQCLPLLMPDGEKNWFRVENSHKSIMANVSRLALG